MDSYIEQIVVHEKNAKDFLIRLAAVLSIFFVFGLGILFGIIINFYFIMVGMFLTAFDIYFCWYIFTGRNIEYEYTVTNNSMQIDKIMHQRRRKEIIDTDINKIEGFDQWKDNHLDENKCHRVFYLGHNESDREQYRFTMLDDKYGRIMVVFAPNEKTLKAVKMYLKPEIKIALKKNQQ